jgi:hypothetical protein
MAEFQLKPKETKLLRECIERGLPVNHVTGSSVIRRIAKLLSRIEKRQGERDIYLELPDADQL